ncbi:MAG: SDR family NAD(P)-dependent oxidoreductase [Acidimicrobiales bacterium]
MFDLSGKLALVTGAGQNVGEGIARALAGAGATVAVNDMSADRAERVAASIGGTPLPFDVTDASQVDAAVTALGPVDILVNNAGVPAGMRPAPFRTLPPDEWRRYIDLNLYGSLHCVDAVIEGMCSRGWGRIVQISSGAGQTGVALGISLYGASKSGIEGFIRHLSQEVAASGVTANSIALGLMDNVGSDAVARMARAVPAGRLGSPADVGAAVVYVASVEASWLTGQTIQLNGGQITT